LQNRICRFYRSRHNLRKRPLVGITILFSRKFNCFYNISTHSLIQGLINRCLQKWISLFKNAKVNLKYSYE
jgi:hypothetical protein